MNKKSRANFAYRIGTLYDEKYLLIVDKDSGSVSVTNDIENVVADICEFEGIDPNQYTIVYKDSMWNWDGWSHEAKDFYPFLQKKVFMLSNIFNIN